MKIFDNVTNIVRDDMEKTIKRNSKVSVAAACFSMYAYSELKKQLESIDEFRFIFTSPTFVTEKAKSRSASFTFLGSLVSRAFTARNLKLSCVMK